MDKSSVKEILEQISAERLTSLTVGGFKAFGAPQSAPLAPLTLLYGPNSAGKSSVLQALALLRQSSFSVDSTLLDVTGPRVDLGSIRSALFDHDTKRPLSLGYSSDLGDISWEFRADFSAKTDRLFVSRFRMESEKGTVELREDLTTEARDDADRPLLRLANMESAEAWRMLLAKNAGDGEPEVQEFLEEPLNAELFRSHALEKASFRFGTLSGIQERVSQGFEALPWPRSGHMSADVAKWIHSHPALDSGLGEHLRRIRELSYLGPLREPPSRLYTPAVQASAAVGRNGGNLLRSLNQLTAPQLSHLNDWLARMEIPYSVDLLRTEDEVMGTLLAVRLRPWTRQHGEEDDSNRGDHRRLLLSPVDVGFGIGQILPILLDGFACDARLTCVEQPELHLHPRLQAQLADFFIDTAGILEGQEDLFFKKQWIIETHSETIVHRVLRRVRDGSISPRDVAVLYVHPGVAMPTGNGPPRFEGSAILPLRIDDEGRFIDPWPDGFFEENLREMLA
jgi:hypothetical protein